MKWEKVEVLIPNDLLAYARSLVDGEARIGLSDVIVEALCRYKTFMDQEKREHEWLKAEIQKGIDAADRGEMVDGPAFMAEWLASFDHPAEVSA